MKISKRGWLLALSLSTLSTRDACSGEDPAAVAPAPMPDRALHVLDSPDESQLRAAAEKAKASGKTAGEGAQRASNGALTAEANAAAKDAHCAEQEAKAAADIAFASTPNDPDAAAKAKAAADAAKKAKEASEKSLAANKAAIDVLSPGDQKKQQAANDQKLAKELSNVITAELIVARDPSVPMNERVSAIDVLGSIAVSHGDLEIGDISPNDTIASYIVKQLLDTSNGQPVSVAKFVVLAEILSASGKHVVAGGKDAFNLAINELYRSAQNDEVRIQRVSSTALAEILTNASVDEDDYLSGDFPDIVTSVTHLIKTHPDGHVRLGLLTALAEKGNSILKHEQDVASAAAERAQANELEKSLNLAEVRLDAALGEFQKAEKSFDDASATINQLNANILAIETAKATINAALSLELAKPMPDVVKKAEYEKALKDADEQKKAVESAKTAVSTLLKDELTPAKETAETGKTNATASQKVAKTKFEAAKAAAEAKSKEKPVAEEALPLVLAALRELSSPSTPVDRVRVEARYALAQFLQGELLPESSKLTFAASPAPTDRQPLAACDRPGVSSINSERMGVTHTRSFNPAQDVTNRAKRGSRVAAPPQSLRIPGQAAKFSADAPEVKGASGATRVTVPAFVPGTMPSPATPATGIAKPASSSSSGSSSGG